MTIEITGQGSLFSSDFLTETIQQTQEWQEFSFSASSSIEVKLRSAFDKFPINQNTNESQTEDDLIWPVLSLLGWTDALRQQNLSAKGRDGDEKLIVWHGLHGPVPILIHIRPCGSGKATPAARREAPC